MPTIRDVAQRAQVSPGTVSQMLNGRARPQPQTRQRIERAIAELGYRRNRVGRPKQTTQLRQIALVLPGQPLDQERRHPLARRRANAIRAAVAESGDHFALFAGRDHVSRDWPLRDAISNGDIDGVILASCYTEDGYEQWLVEQAVPLVVFERFPKHHEFSYVAVDNHTGGRLAAEHFTSLGHQRLAFVRAMRVFDWTKVRYSGFEDAAAKAELQKPMLAAIDPDHGTIDDHAAAVAGLLDAGVTAVFAAGDGLACMVIDAVEKLGLTVPDDISVIGFDDMNYRSTSGLRPTTFAYDANVYASTAVDMIRRLLDEDDHVSHLAACVKPRLIHYQTTDTLRA